MCPSAVFRTLGHFAGNHRRALRFAVLWRKIMPGTYNAKGDRWVERILSLRETCRLRGLPPFPVLVEAVTCYFNGRHPDVSWI
jgi:transposase